MVGCSSSSLDSALRNHDDALAYPINSRYTHEEQFLNVCARMKEREEVNVPFEREGK